MLWRVTVLGEVTDVRESHWRWGESLTLGRVADVAESR